jgi:hypothetical protein
MKIDLATELQMDVEVAESLGLSPKNRTGIEIVNVGKETESEIREAYAALEAEYDLNAWHVYVHKGAESVNLDVTTTAPDGVRSSKGSPHVDGGATAIIDFVRSQYERWQERSTSA